MINFEIHSAILSLEGGRIGVVGDQRMNLPDDQKSFAHIYYKADRIPESGAVRLSGINLAVVVTHDSYEKEVGDWKKNFIQAVKAGEAVLLVGPKKGHFPGYEGQRFSEKHMRDLAILAGMDVNIFSRPAERNTATGMQLFGYFTKGEGSRVPTKKSINDSFRK